MRVCSTRATCLLVVITFISCPFAEGPQRAKATAQKQKASRRFHLRDLAQIVNVSDPQISPDGKSIVVVVSRPNYRKNRHDTELVLVDIAGGKQRMLTYDREDVEQPRWSPTGDRLAFLAKNGSGKNAKTQLYVMPMNGGDARRITSAPEGVDQFSWKPDGHEIAYAADEESPNKKARDKGEDAFEVGDDPFTQKSQAMPTHIWLVSADGGKARKLTSGATSLAWVPPPSAPASRLSWTPDGRSLTFAQQVDAHSGDSDRVTVQILDVASKKTHALTDRKALETYPTFSPDGSHITYWYPRDDNPNNVNEVWLAPALGGKGRCLTRSLDRNLYLSEWTPDGKAVLVGGNDGTHVALWLQPVDGSAKRLNLGAVNASSLFSVDATVGKDGAIAFTGTEPQHPRELYYLKSPDATPRRLTHFNDKIAALSLGKVEEIIWSGPDGFTENGVLIYPPDFTPKKKYPLVLLVHGGPQSASTTGWSALAQLIAAHDYVVFEPNYRGSDNMGNRYQHAIIKDWGAGPGRDVIAGLEAVRKRGFVDSKRIAVTGWSYGGYMTGWLTSHYHVWKTALAGAPFLDWIEDYNISDGNVQDRYGMGGSPWKGDVARAYREQSPITYASQIRTPMLILCDTGDTRCPITQSYALYHALKDNGVPVKFVAYPVGGHFPDDPVRGRDICRRWVAWLDKYLR